MYIYLTHLLYTIYTGTSHGGQRRSHRVPICKALYNHVFRQVVSGDDESGVCVWDVTCGALNFMFHNAHGYVDAYVLQSMHPMLLLYTSPIYIFYIHPIHPTRVYAPYLLPICTLYTSHIHHIYTYIHHIDTPK